MLPRVSLRTLLLYNFGLALVFLLIGALSMVSFDLVHPTRSSATSALSPQARQALSQEEDLERLRARSLYYFDMSAYMRRAKVDDAERLFNDVRLLSFSVAALFVLNAVFALLMPAKREEAPA